MADASVDTALTGRRPRVRLNGAETVQLAELMERMAVHHALNQPARLQLETLHSPAMALSAVYANRRLGLGDTIEIREGETATPPLFRGDITGCRVVQQHAQPKRATITALDRLERMNFTRHSRVLRDIADADLFQQLFSRYGLPATITLSDANTIQPVVTQVRQTDLAFLQLRAGQGDFYFLLQPGGDVRVADYAISELSLIHI